MAIYQLDVPITTDDKEQAKRIRSLMIQMLTVAEHNDVEKLLSAVIRKPGLVKTALKFI